MMKTLDGHVQEGMSNSKNAATSILLQLKQHSFHNVAGSLHKVNIRTALCEMEKFPQCKQK